MEVTALEMAVDPIRDVIAALELRDAARLGQEQATGAEQ